MHEFENNNDEISYRLDEVVENVNRVRRIVQIEIENITRFNEIAQQIENGGANLEDLRGQLYDCLQIIIISHIVCRNGYENFQTIYDELTQ